jgi:hypothetical protein
VIVVDTGRVGPGAARSDEDEWRTTTLYDAMVKMGYDAVGITIADFQFGRDYLEKMAGTHKVPLVACNIVDSKTGKLFMKPYVVKTAGDFVVAIIGLSSREDFQYPSTSLSGRPRPLAPGVEEGVSGLTFLDPNEALEKTFKELQRHRPRPNVYALISAIDTRKLPMVLSAFPQISVVFNDGQLGDLAATPAPPPPSVPTPGGTTKPVTPAPRTTGRADRAQVGDAWVYLGSYSYTGKLVGQIILDYEQGKIRSQDVRWTNLGTEYADDPEIRKLVNRFYAQASKKVELEGTARPKNKWAKLESNPRNGFIGAEACAECHSEEHALWKQTKHADATLTLVSRNKHYHPDCVSCHDTGYGYPTGFKIADQTPTLSNVQCEACHGPGRLHREAKSAEFIRAKPGKEYCVECHDSQQSPDLEQNFDFYYQRVKHTQEAVNLQRTPRDVRAPDAPGRRSW